MLRTIHWLTPLMAITIFATIALQSARAGAPPSTAPGSPAGAGGTLIINVVDADGNPVADAHVHVSLGHAGGHHHQDNPPPQQQAAGDPPNGGNPAPDQKPNHPKPVAEGTTDDKGSVTLDGIPAGDYRVGAHKHGVGGGHQSVTLKDGDSQTITITLKARPNGGGGHGGGGHTPNPANPQPPQ